MMKKFICFLCVVLISLSFFSSVYAVTTDYNYFANNGVSQPFNFIVHSSVTYFDPFTFVVWQGTDLDIYGAIYNETSAEWSEIYFIAENPLGNDDHGAPTLVKDQNGYMHVFYGCHNTYVKHVKSNNPLSFDGFTAMDDFTDNDATYPLSLRVDTRIYVFYRQHVSTTYKKWVWKRSSDNGESWGAKTFLVDFGDNFWVYMGFFEFDGDESVHFAWSINNVTAGRRQNIYHAYLNTTDVHCYSMNGTDLGLSISLAEATANCLVVDTGSVSKWSNHPALHVDEDGYPLILFVNGSGTNFFFNMIRWSGASWDASEQITDCDSAWSFGDFLINNKTNDVDAFVSSDGITSVRGGDMEKWVWTGDDWSLNSTILTEFSTGYSLNSPVVSHPNQGVIKMVFVEVHYNLWLDNTAKLYAVDDLGAFVVRSVVVTQPWWSLHIEFILGLIGLACIVVSPVWLVSRLKSGDVGNGLVYGLAVLTIGFGLLITWLWS